MPGRAWGRASVTPSRCSTARPSPSSASSSRRPTATAHRGRRPRQPSVPDDQSSNWLVDAATRLVGRRARAQRRRRDGALPRRAARPAAGLGAARGDLAPASAAATTRCAVGAARGGDGADRGRAAGRPGVRGRRAPTGAEPRADGRHRRHAAPGAPGRAGRGRRARFRGRGARRGPRHRRRPGRCCRSCSGTPAPGFGPFDVPWLHLVGIAGFGLLSALLAAVVPAWIASRQDVVAVLAGRRGDAPGLRSPILGVVLLGVGIAGVGRRRDRAASSRSPSRRSWPCSA